MSKVDHSLHEIVIDGRTSIKFSKYDVASVFGIPCSGARVLENGMPPKDTINYISSEYLGLQPKDTRSIKVVRELIERNYGGVMSAREEEGFKIAFVVYVMSALLAPRAKYDYAAVDYWNAILDPSKIRSYDWADHVLRRLMDSVVKVKADLKNAQKVCNITGCCLFLQVLYLDSMDLGVWNMDRSLLPRIRCFSAVRIRSMITADSRVVGDAHTQPEFGKSKLREPEGVCYHWAKLQVRQRLCNSTCEHGSAWEATISVCRTLMVPLEAIGPIFLAISDFEDRRGELIRSGGLQFVSALFSIIQPFMEGFRYNAGQRHFGFGSDCNLSNVLHTPKEFQDAHSLIRKRSVPGSVNKFVQFSEAGSWSKCICGLQFCNRSTCTSGDGGIDHKHTCSCCSMAQSRTDQDPMNSGSWGPNSIVRRVMSTYYSLVRRSKDTMKLDLNSSAMEFLPSPVATTAEVEDLGFQVNFDTSVVSFDLRKLLVAEANSMNRNLGFGEWIGETRKFIPSSWYEGGKPQPYT
ncbi:hypothetical protein C2845_PM09G22210 [Panicum miliaceum]|uniref:Aminotransferase-like plant mobile domain-containing protein n=1 Tax=Panicum miliaceum TaxID=4540 RepID=A0A3L6RWC3_PANMI|nr:hypothetical protein C2845_PM09G22210 [Panicum miliaceum]